MQDLTELRFEDNRLLLRDSLVRSPILPRIASELERDLVIQGNCVLEGAVYARNLQIEHGPLRIKASVFAQLELHVNVDARGDIVFEKAVGSANAVVSHAPGVKLFFLSDVSAKQIKLRNAYIAASIFGDDVILEDCVVIGGVFASRSLELNNCVVGTFNSPTVRCSKRLQLLLPSAFSVESVSAQTGTECYNLALADLGALMRGIPEAKNSGRIAMNLSRDGQRTVLVGEGTQQTLTSYSIVGKVLAADMLNLERMQNHFLLTTAALGSQLLRTYDLGDDANGNRVDLTPERVSDFFFKILDGRVQAQDLDGTFTLADVVGAFGEAAVTAGTATAGVSASEQPTLQTSIDPALICPECGSPVQNGDPTCAECGSPLG